MKPKLSNFKCCLEIKRHTRTTYVFIKIGNYLIEVQIMNLTRHSVSLTAFDTWCYRHLVVGIRKVSSSSLGVWKELFSYFYTKWITFQ